jgi:hypothetical protein
MRLDAPLLLAAAATLLVSACSGDILRETASPSPVRSPERIVEPGHHRVGLSLIPGRYYTDPIVGCYWERQSEIEGSTETIAAEYVGFDATQWIVDIEPSDYAFQTNGACGIWSNVRHLGPQTTIGPGKWLVGAQVLPGIYRSAGGLNCYWERIRNFVGGRDSAIAAGLAASAGDVYVELAATDAGFTSEGPCGNWVPVDPPAGS